VTSLARAQAPRNEPAVVLAERDVIVGMTGRAAEWLEMLHGSRVELGDAVPFSLLPVVRRLEALAGSHGSPEPPHFTIATREGPLLEVHAARLLRAHGQLTVAITIAPADASARSSLILAARGLTPAQRRVVGLVLRGFSTREIVVALSIGEHTVQDHLKAVFEKTGVGSRRELVSAFLR